MRLIFAGTPEFSRVALEHLHAAGHEIALVLTQPDRPAGPVAAARSMHWRSVQPAARGQAMVRPAASMAST